MTDPNPTDAASSAGPANAISVSFEFFPPKTPPMAEALWQAVTELAPLAPRFVSVTYGAGGSTRERTHATVLKIQRETGIPVAAHLTCVGASREEIRAIARTYWEQGIRHIVALRGDPPATPDGRRAAFEARPDGYRDAAELVADLRALAPFELSVAAYPEVHPEAPSAEADLAHLKRKLEAGACRAITQFFFDPELFLRFRDRARAAGITAELVPGILPVHNVAATLRMARMTGTSVPPWVLRLFDGLDERPEARQLVAAHVAAEQVRRLAAEGVRHFHFYTLNRADLTWAVCRILGRHADPDR
ncbi:MAG: methylenetetrahydrofolate reductase [NAD(P)H] [Sphingomonadaceae bacterium]|uniref:methylenetetrahydrofolate reductase [NAD(P)H] n=1 Tax=Thermaurantiacus sp. TaxID=2820283 RepID=UPI00298EF1A2|nr:methylenetetrahydrofolate reductase [NAD(P)H] [Thermaurantiacus sp.]MCS6985874.1 methylenetetrahydrofolate reductase [NAD(P)H] [Sphingomonadaceae bacterium]MDW8413857.1 methylenetetrahydrofolate reductase [NAD(P)H] [Thermaurantiacus sp.]